MASDETEHDRMPVSVQIHTGHGLTNFYSSDKCIIRSCSDLLMMISGLLLYIFSLPRSHKIPDQLKHCTSKLMVAHIIFPMHRVACILDLK